jgi:SPP1 family predicted phage head-tail adaptor
MSIASLANRTVTVERATVSSGSFGGVAETWAPVCRVTLRVQPLSGADVIRHSKDDMTVTHKCYTPGTPDIQAGDRFEIDGKTLLVRAVRNIDQLDKFLTLECEERDA